MIVRFASTYFGICGTGLFLFFIGASLCSAQDPLAASSNFVSPSDYSTPSRLTEVNGNLTALLNEQKQISKEIAASEKASAQFAKEIASAQGQLIAGDNQLKELHQNASGLVEEIEDYSQRYKEIAEQSKLRLRALYIAGGGSQMAIKTSLEGGKADLGRISRYMSTLRAHELSTLQELRRLNSERLQRIEELQKRTKELEGLQLTAKNQQQLLVRKQQEHEGTKLALKKHRLNKSRVIAELRAEALRLETVLSSLGSVEEPSGEPLQPVSGGKGSPIESIPPSSGGLPVQAFGSGLLEKFDPPTKGQLVTRYGATISDGLGQSIKSKGIGYAAPEGQEVLSVGDGKVSFVGELGSFGLMVIIDHGQRTFSLYGQLASASVQNGAQVQNGGSLGRVGPVVSPRSHNLYFEIRKEGKTLDPKSLLR